MASLLAVLVQHFQAVLICLTFSDKSFLTFQVKAPKGISRTFSHAYTHVINLCIPRSGKLGVRGEFAAQWHSSGFQNPMDHSSLALLNRMGRHSCGPRDMCIHTILYHSIQHYMCICVYIYIYTHMYVYVYVCIIHIYIYTYIHIRIKTHYIIVYVIPLHYII